MFGIPVQAGFFEFSLNSTRLAGQFNLEDHLNRCIVNRTWFTVCPTHVKLSLVSTSTVHPPSQFSTPPQPSATSLLLACDVVDAGELVMLWMPTRGPGSPLHLTAPRTTHAALRPGSQRRWPPRSSAVGRGGEGGERERRRG
ncbi:hypothetical protein TIFTF001_003655 [Ficus carica]|uniref:Uncharacterized protein n=1 Tax=Ficus carica TaxID=3494 RepID=A0AA87ZUK1_FICCA|nr:hypothetical protein TIFTF001_003655 [Ficus carica]